jgi:hypothetical protein
MNIENTIREALHSHSGEAPESAGLLDAAEARSSRRRQRRHVAGAGIAVAATITAVLVAPSAIRGVTGEAAPGNATAAAPQESGAAPQTATQSPAQEAGSTTLVPAPAFEMPDFPYTPGWVPEGLSDPYYRYEHFNLDDSYEPGSGLSNYMIELDYYNPEGQLAGIRIQVRPQDFELMLDKMMYLSRSVDEDETTYPPPEPLTRQEITVRGREAVLLSSDEQAVVSWRHNSDQWVLLEGGSVDEVLRYADELVEEPFTARTPFTFELMPAGAELRLTTPKGMSFEPLEFGPGYNVVDVSLLRGGPGTVTDCPDAPEAIEVESDVCPLPREPVQVGEYAGELVGDYMVLVYLDNNVALSVVAGGTLSLSREDLLRFAAGIQVTPDALPGS